MPKLKIELSPFTIKVIAMVKKIPRGRVATYGQIAELAGKPGSARAVGWILNSFAESRSLPWQRVINAQGGISFDPRTDEFREQKRLLEKEGVRFLDRAGKLDLGKYRWKKKVPAPKRGTPSMFSKRDSARND